MATTAHGTLTADEITTVQIAAGRRGFVVVNPSQTGVIWIALGDNEPIPYGDHTYACYGVREFPLTYDKWGDTITVKLLTDAEKPYDVEAY